MAQSLAASYEYNVHPGGAGLRVVELLPGGETDSINCKLHTVEWSTTIPYEAISYAWGDAKIREDIFIQGKRLDVMRSLHSGLTHLRYEDRSRFLWVDAIW